MKTYLNALLHRPDVVSGVPVEPVDYGGPLDDVCPPDEDVDVEVAPIPAPGEDDE